MGFSTALSGLNAAAASLQVIGNNIANANTTGFKESRAEFADFYTSTGRTTPGAGVKLTEVAQQFNQGIIESTHNNLDLAIAGNGFFALGESSDSNNANYFTRNGAFHLSPEGYMINDTGHFLMGGAPNGTTVSEGFNIGGPQAIKIDTAQGAPSATTTVDLTINLDSREGNPSVAFAGYDPATSSGPDVDSYNSSTSASIFDSLGNTHTLTTYFVDETTPGDPTSTWSAYVYLDGKGITAPNTFATPAGVAIPMEFDALGNLMPVGTGTDAAGSSDNFVFTNLAINPAPALGLGVAAEPLTFSINPTGSTQYASNFGVNDLQQDGFASGNLTGVSVDKEGVVLTRFSNGRSAPL